MGQCSRRFTLTRFMAILKPWPGSPIRFFLGTRTLSKMMSASTYCPVMGMQSCTRRTPGLSRSMRIAEMPSAPRVGSVTHMVMAKSANMDAVM
ncbi:hypothetical protein D3C73_1208210 [compost metagenome]